MMQARNITLTLAQHQLLKGVDLQLRAGELVVLLGANGAGKSSLLHILAGSSEHAYSAQELSYDGENNLNLKQLAQRRAVLSQSAAVPFELSVRQVLEMGLYPFEQLSQEQQEQLLDEAMPLAGVSELQNRLFNHLSGGEQQRSQFARVLVQVLAQQLLWPDRPAYLFLDEPLNSLDPQYQLSVLRVIRQVCDTRNLGVLMVLHDVNWAAYYADRIVLLHEGRILVDDKPKQALSVENLRAVFGLTAHIQTHPIHPDKLWLLWQDE